MNQVLVAVLAFCAIPCALGLSCYSCIPTAVKLCNMEGQLDMVTDCMRENATCDMTKFVSNHSVTSYRLGCGNSSECDATNTTLCTEAAASLANRSLVLTMCYTNCSTGNYSNKPVMMPSPSTTVVMSTSASPSSSSTMSTKPSAGDKLRPVFGVLFMILFSVILSNPVRQ